MNNWVGIGNLVRDPEVRQSGEGKSVCRFTVAINDGWGERKETSYIPVVCFGKTAENCGRFLAKGSKVAVNGRIKTGSYTKQDGTKVYTTDVIANNVEFLSTREEPAQQGYQTSFDDAPSGFRQVDDDVPF